MKKRNLIKVCINCKEEFNGDFWHCNPSLFEESYYNKVKCSYAKDLWEYDEIKKIAATSNGYDYLIVWENDYRKDPIGVIKRCLEFLCN